MTDYKDRHNYEKIDEKTLKAFIKAVEPLNALMRELGKSDLDSFLNEMRDALVAYICEYDYVNGGKHGMDAWQSIADRYLEAKSTGKDNATFNDTTYEKCDLFAEQNMYVALAHFCDLSHVDKIWLCPSANIVDYLRDGVRRHELGLVGRSSQTISAKRLVREFGAIEVDVPDFDVKAGDCIPRLDLAALGLYDQEEPMTNDTE